MFTFQSLTIEGENVIVDIVFDVAQTPAGGSMVGVGEAADTKGGGELGEAADNLGAQPRKLLLRGVGVWHTHLKHSKRF